jgi:hypothetical protein
MVDLVLVQVGDRPVSVLKIIYEATGFDLAACIHLRDRLPSTITVPEAEAHLVAARLQDAGATLMTEPAPRAPDRIADLERLGDLHARGILSDAEFAAAKARVLDQI